MIAKLWHDEIVARRRYFQDVPIRLKEKVRQLLIASGHEDFIIE